MIHQVILGKWVADKCNVALQRKLTERQVPMWPQPSSDLPTTPTTSSDKICDHSRGSKDSDSTDTWPHSEEETERSFNSSFDDLSDAFTSKSIRKRCSPSTDTISPAKCESLSSRRRKSLGLIVPISTAYSKSWSNTSERQVELYLALIIRGRYM